jgi:purine catabolism regulator
MTAALTVGDLVASPALQLRVRAGRAGLAAAVTWAHVSELTDPTPWLSGGELIMTTGIGVPRRADDQVAYLERLHAASVSGLVVSTELHVPPLTRRFLDRADALSFPVLEVPLPVPFIAIAQEVAAATHSDMHRRLTAQLHVFGALRTLASEDVSLTELFARLERLSGYQLFVCTAHGRPLLPGVPTPPGELVIQLPQGFDAPPTIPGGYALPVPAPGGPAGFLVAVAAPDVVPAGLAVVQHIATVAALQLALQRHDEEAWRRQAAETLTELLQSDVSPELARGRLTRLGFDVATPLVLLDIRSSRTSTTVDDAVAWLETLSDAVLVLRQGHAVVALLAADAVAAAAEPDWVIGVSRRFNAGDPLEVPRREAAWAAARAGDAGGGLVHFGDDPAGHWLADDASALRRLVATMLGPALDYDDAHGTQVVTTVRVWLERDRNTQAAATALQVHPNTLGYRLRRFEELTGQSLQRTDAVAQVWLALRAHVALAVHAPSAT